MSKPVSIWHYRRCHQSHCPKNCPLSCKRKRRKKWKRTCSRFPVCGYWINRLAHHLQGLPSGMGGAGPTVPPSPPSPCWCGGQRSPGPARFTPICSRSAHDTLISTSFIAIFCCSVLSYKESLWEAIAGYGCGSNTKGFKTWQWTLRGVAGFWVTYCEKKNELKRFYCQHKIQCWDLLDLLCFRESNPWCCNFSLVCFILYSRISLHLISPKITELSATQKYININAILEPFYIAVN